MVYIRGRLLVFKRRTTSKGKIQSIKKMMFKKFKKKSAQNQQLDRKTRRKKSEVLMDAPVNDFIVHVYDNLLDSSV